MSDGYGVIAPPNSLILSDFDTAEMLSCIEQYNLYAECWSRVDVRLDIFHNRLGGVNQIFTSHEAVNYFTQVYELLISKGHAKPDAEVNFWCYGPPEEIIRSYHIDKVDRTYNKQLENLIQTQKLCANQPYNVYFTNTVHIHMLKAYQSQHIHPHNWEPGLPAGAIFGKVNVKRSSIIEHLTKSDADFIFSLPNPERYTEHIKDEWELSLYDWSTRLSSEILTQAKYDNRVGDTGIPSGFEYPQFMYRRISLEIVNESHDFLDECWVSEKITRPLWAGMPWIGSPLNDQIIKDCGFLSYYDLMGFELPAIDDYLGDNCFGDHYYNEYARQVITPATLQFQEMCTDPEFVCKVKETIEHNRNNMEVFSRHLDKWRTHSYWGDLG